MTRYKSVNTLNWRALYKPDPADYGKVPKKSATGSVTIWSTDLDGKRHSRRVPVSGPIPGVAVL
jgi:hypothetical protein